MIRFYGLGNFIGWVWQLLQLCWGRWWGFPEIGPPPTISPLMVSFWSVMASVGVSFSLLMCYNARIMRLTVSWKLNLPPSWTQLVPIGLCHIFKDRVILLDCALSSFLPFYFSFRDFISTFFWEAEGQQPIFHNSFKADRHWPCLSVKISGCLIWGPQGLESALF